ncbi:MAG: serine/threonine-protein phosphatase [Nitrospinae bacterium]|nr:serine/threonine-protein phosphatase [Nitrospinota bacterium]
MLREINRNANSIAANNLFFTAIYAIYNCDIGAMTVSSAGGIPFILANPVTGKRELIKISGTICGIFEEDEFEADEKEILLETGDCIIFQTDGLLESKNSDEQNYDEISSQERFMQQIKKDRNPNEIIAAILEDTQKHVGEGKSYEDDITLMVITKR